MPVLSSANDGSPLQTTSQQSALSTQHSALVEALADAAADVGVAPNDDALLREFARVATEFEVEGLVVGRATARPYSLQKDEWGTLMCAPLIPHCRNN